MSRKRPHLTPGWTWRCDQDGDPAIWGIYGHVSDDEARACVDAYEGAEGVVGNYTAVTITRNWQRSVPCASTRGAHDPLCPGDCSGSHLVESDTPGSSPYTWVEASP